jgi:hypothetical protein
MKMSLVLVLSSAVLPLVNGVTSCKLFHKKDKWHHWNKLYYIWIKLTLIAMYKSSFIQIKWEKIQLWKLVCFIMQLKWYSTTTFPNIMRKKIKHQRKYPKLWIFSLYIIYLTTFDIKIIIYFPAKNNCMLVTPRTERYEGVQHILKKKLSWWFSRLHIMWIYHCNVGKTKRLKKNTKETIWCHQKMNRKKYMYFDNNSSKLR